MYRLMIKTHTKTGLKYLCFSGRKDYLDYPGSGTYWRRHLKEHGETFTTEVLFESLCRKEIKQYGILLSESLDVVGSKEWANLCREEGTGSDTVSGKFWITNGIKDRYIDKGKRLPKGWQKGRSTGAFVDSKKQQEFSTRVDRKRCGLSIKKAWDEGRFIRDHSKCGVRGERNSSKRPEVRAKISASRIGHKRSLDSRQKQSATCAEKRRLREGCNSN